MRALMYLLSALAVMGLAFWAYRENYRTQAQIDEMQAVQNEIARLRDDLGVLRAEWAYLNRPERLRELVDINFQRLKLGPVQADQFGGARNVDYPDPNAIQPDSGGAVDAADPAAQAPVPSNNRGAPKPRPLRPAGLIDNEAADTADDMAADDMPAEEALVPEDTDAPVDTAVTADTTDPAAPATQE